MKKLYSLIKEDFSLIKKAFLKNKKIILPIFSGVIFAMIMGKIDIVIILLACIAFVDFNTLYIPDVLNYLIILIGLMKFNSFFIFIGIFLISFLFYYARRDALGYGDIKLIFGLSLNYGPNVFSIIIFSVLISYIFEKKGKIAFGYYLFWGTIIEKIWFFNFNPFSFF